MAAICRVETTDDRQTDRWSTVHNGPFCERASDKAASLNALTHCSSWPQDNPRGHDRSSPICYLTQTSLASCPESRAIQQNANVLLAFIHDDRVIILIWKVLTRVPALPGEGYKRVSGSRNRK